MTESHIHLLAAQIANSMQGSIYLVFDYMEHDLAGLMERQESKLEIGHVR